MATPDTPATSDLEVTERGGTLFNASHDDDSDVPVKGESSPVAGSKLTDDSDQSPGPSANLDQVRTLHGFKVSSSMERCLLNDAQLTDIRSQWFLAYASLLSTVLFYALDGTIVCSPL